MAARGASRSLADALGDSQDADAKRDGPLPGGAARQRAPRGVELQLGHGDTPTLPKVESMEQLLPAHDVVSKLSGEQTRSPTRGGGRGGGGALATSCFRPRGEPAGRATAAVISLFPKVVLSGGTAHVNGDGGSTCDFTYVDNVVDAHLRAAFGPADCVSGPGGERRRGRRPRSTQLLELVREVSGVDVPASTRRRAPATSATACQPRAGAPGPRRRAVRDAGGGALLHLAVDGGAQRRDGERLYAPQTADPPVRLCPLARGSPAPAGCRDAPARRSAGSACVLGPNRPSAFTARG